ncbi:MAG TPA: hypothetical protein VEK07_15800 [Polyangiaceae bacterium]|nr:hypothetical protein [Polyangiaceae bacterium]
MPSKRRRSTRGYWLAGAAAAVGIAPVAGACGSAGDAPLIGGSVPLSNVDAAPICVPGHEGCPCTTPGATAACGKVVQEYENYTTCAEGQSTCSDGVWGPCATGSTIVAKSTRTLSLGSGRDPVTGIPRLAQTITTCAEGGLTAASVCDPNTGCSLTIETPSDFADASNLSQLDGGLSIVPTIEYEGGGTGDGNTSCTGLQCQVQYCAGNSNGTTITGQVFDPAGNNPLYNAWVYIPLNPTAALPAFPAGEQCSTCSGAASLNAVAVAQTAPDGTFTLTNVPSGTNIPIVVQMGKWRREIQLSNVTACTNNAQPSGTLRLPQSQTDGLNGHADLPQIAFVSGSADPFECMLLKAGISPSEFGSSTLNSNRRIHYYNSPNSPGDSIDPSYGNVVTGDQMWNSADGGSNGGWSLANYDVVILACEGAEYNVSDRSTSGYANLVTYAGNGGRVFLSHYSYVWMKYNTPWEAIPASWGGTMSVDTQDPLYASIVTSGFPKGQAFQTWLGDVGALVAPDGGTLTAPDGGAPAADAGGVLTIHQARQDLTTPLASTAQSWMSATDTAIGALTPATYSPSFTFNTPLTAATASQCGRVVFSDFHVATSAQVSASGSSGTVSCQATSQCGYGSTCESPVLGTCQQPTCTTGGTSGCGDSHFTCNGVVPGTCQRASCTSGSQCGTGECVTVNGNKVCGCTQNSDCGVNGVCTSHVCNLVSCTTSSGCYGGNFMENESNDATCQGAVLGTCTPNACTSNAQCSALGFGFNAGQEQCDGGVCGSCYTNSDCPGGGTCVGGIPGGTCSGNGKNFPYECEQSTLDPQEAALEFEFFDLSACVSPNGIVPQGPPAPITVYNPVSFTVDYTSSCPAGTHVAWRTLTWQADVPATASIVFSAQTVNPPTDGGPPSFTGAQSVTIATATNATQTGSAGIDLVSTDGGPSGAFELASPPVSSQSDLQLTITLNPTTNQQAPPTLIDWQVTSDCPSSE